MVIFCVGLSADGPHPPGGGSGGPLRFGRPQASYGSMPVYDNIWHVCPATKVIQTYTKNIKNIGIGSLAKKSAQIPLCMPRLPKSYQCKLTTTKWCNCKLDRSINKTESKKEAKLSMQPQLGQTLYQVTFVYSKSLHREILMQECMKLQQDSYMYWNIGI